MQEYKKKIYELWGEKAPMTFVLPDDNVINKQRDFYGNFFIRKFFPADKNISILDIGCGYGIFLNACKSLGYKNVFGVEIIKECVEFIKNKFNIIVYQSEIISYLESVKDESFDIITAFDVMEHFKKDEIVSVLKLINSKLKKGGFFIMKVPNAGSMSGLYLLYSDLTHETAFTSLLIKEILHLADFSKIKILPEYNPKNINSLSLYLIQTLVGKVSHSLRDRYIFSGNIIVIGYK